MRLILDTNFLIHSITYRIDIIDELRRVLDFNYEIYILDKTIEELKKINSLESQIAQKLVTKFKIIKTTKGYVDDILVNISTKNDVIATQDKILKKRLKEKNIKVLIIRQKKYYQLISS